MNQGQSAAQPDPRHWRDWPNERLGGFSENQVNRYPCERCGAREGGSCFTESGYSARTHAVRVKLAVARLTAAGTIKPEPIRSMLFNQLDVQGAGNR